MKKYEFSMYSGRSLINLILTEPKFENGTIRATQVARMNFTESGTKTYQKCDEKEFIAGGGPYTLVEYTGVIE